MENNISRKELIRQKIEEEEKKELLQLSGIRMKVWQFLTKDKGFSKEEILIDPEFELKLSDCIIKVSIDFIIKLNNSEAMLIRCSPTSIESWERYILAFARVIKETQIPYAAVTDGERARIMDVLTGKVIGERIEDLPSKDELCRAIQNLKPSAFPSERLEREKRIVYAFEGVKCEVRLKAEEIRLKAIG
ncbi:MAG: type I restriction enzyme HsdR N-terminal domain-containing protein [Thermodesulfovibrionales bacterium]